MACGALASASLWLFNLSQAQDQQQTSALPPWAQQPAAETNPNAKAQPADPFAGATDGFRPVDGSESIAQQTVIRQRIQNELRLAVESKEKGDSAEALRRATAAHDLAKRFQISFNKNELKPSDLIADLKGISPDPVSEQQLASGQPQDRDAYAQYLVKTAREYLQAGNAEAAMQKAQEARALQATFGPFDERPEHILADVARMKTSPAQQQLASGFENSPFITEPKPAAVTQTVTPNTTQTTAPVANNNTMPSATSENWQTKPNSQAKQQSQQLLTSAEQAVHEGRFDDARNLAKQASQLPVAYDLFDKKPDQILAMIERASNTRMIASQPQPKTEAVVAPVPTVTADLTSTRQRETAIKLLNEAKADLARGNLAQARAKVAQANQFDVTYNVFDERPDLIMAQIDAIEKQQMLAQTPVTPVPETAWETNVNPIAGVESTPAMTATPAPYEVAENSTPPVEVNGVVNGQEAYREGIANLRNNDRAAARQAFLVAFENQSDLTGQQKQQLQDLLRDLSTSHNEKIKMVNGQVLDTDLNEPSDRINMVRQQQSVEFDRLRSESFNAIYQAERLRETDSQKALDLIDQAMTSLAASNLPPEQADALVSRLRSSRGSIEKYREQRAPLITMQKRNEEVRGQIEQERKLQIRVEQDLADMTEEFNRLMRERRYPEAEIVAKKAKELSPSEPVTELMVWKAKFARRNASNEDLRDRKEENFWTQLDQVEQSSINPVANDSIAYPDAKEWAQMSKLRKQFGGPDNRERSPEELEIIDSLSQPISLHFDNEPLSEVFRQIAQLADINIWTDEQGLEEVGASSNTPVTMHIDGIKLRSAFNLLLEPYGLDYSIDDDVLKVTSSLRLQGELMTTF
ncbi:MAG TPA: hypothetical protein DIW81_26100 [Planctomycetaceae bacterium]|nr:hypothetical protein [Planctomycetaceae bacterium]